jgi:hypothetical protein
MRRSLGSWLLRAALALGLLAARPAAAAEPLGFQVPTPTPPATGGTDQAVVARYWELGRTRPFMATTLDAGIAYVRPRFAAGYGRPFWSWIGVEAQPVVSLGGLGHYVGAALAVPGLTLRGGARYFYPFSRSFQPPQESYTRTDIELLRGPKADYLSFEGELTATRRLFRGSAFAVLTGYRVALAPEGFYLFEESLRAVMKPPFIWRARLGYLFAFGRGGAIRVGGAAEVIGLPGRDEFVIRGGLLGSVLMSAQLEAQASLIPVLVSPDTLGYAGGDFGQLGVRFIWATDSKPDPKRLREAVQRDKAREREKP